MRKDSIFSLITSYGKAAVSIIRISGFQLQESLSCFLGNFLETRKLKLKVLKDPRDGSPVDQCFIVFFSSPFSYTGEDVIEIQSHGSVAVIDKICDILSFLGLRQAHAGEFTLRSFQNGKMTLTEVESLKDLIESETEIQRKRSLSNMLNKESSFLKNLKNSIKNILSTYNYVIDFDEFDDLSDLIAQAKKELLLLTESIRKCIEDYPISELLRSGIKVSLLGPPNSGKSSFINYFSKKKTSIVSSIPGTTRDLVSTDFDFSGYLVKIVDTAGIRETSDLLESEGIAMAYESAKISDFNFLIFDASDIDENQITSFLDVHNPFIILNKMDLAKDKNFSDFIEGYPVYKISLLSLEGVDSFKNAFISVLNEKKNRLDTDMVLNRRTQSLLKEALIYLDKALSEDLFEFSAEDLRYALKCFDEIDGVVASDDILELIFKDFCVGK